MPSKKIGVEKALKIAENADLVIAIIDNSKDLDNEDIKILNIIEDKNAIIVLNKIDKDDKKAENRREIVKTNKPIIKISAVTKEGIEDLYNEIVKMFNINKIEATNDTVITNVRHKNQIDKAVKSINEAINVAKRKANRGYFSNIYKANIGRFRRDYRRQCFRRYNK